MAYGDIGSVHSTLEFDPQQATYITISKVNDTIAAILACETGGNAKISSIEVNPALPYAITLIDSLIFGYGATNIPHLGQRDDNCKLAHFYDHTDGIPQRNQVASIIVNGDGSIGAAVDDLVVVQADYGDAPSPLSLIGDIIVVVMGDSLSNGWIRTFTCTVLGDIGDTEEDSWEVETGVAQYLTGIKITNSIVAVLYNDSAPDGWIKTISIDSVGAITEAFIDTLKFDDLGAQYMDICHVTGNIYAIAYRTTAGHGKLATVSIDSSGNIGAAIEDSFEFEPGAFTRPSICKVADDMVAIAYTGPDDDGFLVTIEIDAAGAITEPVYDSLEFETVWAQYCAITHMQGDIYVVAYQSTDYDGFVKSIDISTPPIGGPHHEMMMKIGP